MKADGVKTAVEKTVAVAEVDIDQQARPVMVYLVDVTRKCDFLTSSSRLFIQT